MPRLLRPVVLLFAVAASVLPAAAAEAPAATLVGVGWHTVADLEHLTGPGRTLRHVAPGTALVEADPGGHDALRRAGLPILFTDQPSDAEGYFLADHLHAEALPGDVRLVYRDPQDWALLRLPRAREVELLDAGFFLYPLPSRYRLAPPAGAARPAARAPAAAVRALLDEITPERLRDHVEHLAFVEPAIGAVPGNVRTRYARRPETFAATSYVHDQLAAVLGEGAVQLDSFRIEAGDSLMYNVIGELPGTDPEAGYWVVCAHYDATGTRSKGSDMVRIGEAAVDWDWRLHPAPGADDNGTGVALMLEGARVLAQRRFPWSIRFIAWSGEELGLRGSRHYATAAGARGDRILGVLNFDMIGFNDLADRIELVSNPSSTWLVDLMRETGARYELGLRVDTREDRFTGLSDHAPFWAEGYDAMLAIENYLPTDSTSAGVRQGVYRLNKAYHTVVDLPDSINWELVAEATRLMVATLAQFGAETGLPNLAVFAGDLRATDEDDLQVLVANLGTADLSGAFGVRVSRCTTDSSDCVTMHESSHPGPIAAGGMATIDVPWQRYGTDLFLVEVDAANLIEEETESDNRAFVALHLVPTNDVVVYPNPFRPERDRFVRFAGVPLFTRAYVYRLSGDLVWSGREEDQGDLTREIRWRGVNSGGFAVGPGIYLYDLRSFEGARLRRGKIAVVR